MYGKMLTWTTKNWNISIYLRAIVRTFHLPVLSLSKLTTALFLCIRHIMEPCIQLLRHGEAEELLKDGSSFLLLTQIALRARRTKVFSNNGLGIRESFIGDHGNCGLTRQQYRTALSKLVKWGFVTTRPTNKGTVATLLKDSVYNINTDDTNQQDNQPPTIKQPSSNHQATTKKNVNNENNVNNGVGTPAFTLQQCNDKAFVVGMTDQESKEFYDHYNRQGWKLGNGLEMTDLVSCMTSWRNKNLSFKKPEPAKTYDRKNTPEYEARKNAL